MTDFEKTFSNAMKASGFTVRSLEEEIIKKYGSDNKISRGLIGDYRLGKRAPTYDRALIIADVMGIDRDDFLIATFNLKNRTRGEAEWARFKEFCDRRKIKIDKNQVR